jgi:hypothetical protein
MGSKSGNAELPNLKTLFCEATIGETCQFMFEKMFPVPIPGVKFGVGAGPFGLATLCSIIAIFPPL